MTLPVASAQQRTRRGSLFVVAGVIALVGCARPTRTGPLIDAYRQAECLPVKSDTTTRTWDYPLNTREGVVRVSGAELPGGRINLRYMVDSKEAVAANAGDYIYPTDIRFDRIGERLYIKATGVPACFGATQTWLFGYDLGLRREINRARVDPGALPQECGAN